MNWILSGLISFALKYLLTPKNIRWAMGVLVVKLRELAQSTETDFDDKAVDAFKKAFDLKDG